MKRSTILQRLPVVFGYSEQEAAAAIGISASTFRALVEKGDMPKPRMVGTRRVYDVEEISVAFKTLPHDGEESDLNSWDDWVPYEPPTRSRGPKKDSRASADTGIGQQHDKDWKSEIQFARLTEREKRMLNILATHSDRMVRFNEIKGCGPSTYDRLEARGFVIPGARRDNYPVEWQITQAGLEAIQENRETE